MIDTPENRAALQSSSALQAAWSEGRILEARALLCDSAHNLVVDLGCMKGLFHVKRALLESVREPRVISR